MTNSILTIALADGVRDQQRVKGGSVSGAGDDLNESALPSIKQARDIRDGETPLRANWRRREALAFGLSASLLEGFN